MDIPRKYVLVAALAIPVIMIIAVALAVYLPRIWAKPGYDFIYSTNSYYPEQFLVVNGKLTEQNIPASSAQMPAPYPATLPQAQIYYHDTAANLDSSITIAEAQKFNLLENSISPDGYRIEHGQGGGLWFFGGSNYSDVYLLGHGLSQRLNFDGRSDFNFIGWVKK
ncbi:MAG: hypothetical protein ACHQF4_02120 [Sphingobacteriales bacterium]